MTRIAPGDYFALPDTDPNAPALYYQVRCVTDQHAWVQKVETYRDKNREGRDVDRPIRDLFTTDEIHHKELITHPSGGVVIQMSDERYAIHRVSSH